MKICAKIMGIDVSLKGSDFSLGDVFEITLDKKLPQRPEK